VLSLYSLGVESIPEALKRLRGETKSLFPELFSSVERSRWRLCLIKGDILSSYSSNIVFSVLIGSVMSNISLNILFYLS